MKTDKAKIIEVPLPQKPYSIFVASKSVDWDRVTPLLPRSRAVVITSPRVKKFCLPTLRGFLRRKKIECRTILIPDGERHKNLKTVQKIYGELVKCGVDRQTPLLLLGGGVLGDMGGFIAATYLRGVPFIQIPTTLVAQVDSSIGGKLGVDLPEGKNLVGVFDQPQAVFSYVPFLKTLPQREILGGLGEVLKYGVIAEPDLFHATCAHRDRVFSGDLELLENIVYRSSAIKAKVVAQDERESKLRMILNFGHTFGHALEKLTGYRRFLHGEAVGIGMAIAAHVSHRLGFCAEAEKTAVFDGLKEIGFSLKPPSFSKAEWIRALRVDKKSRGGMIHFVFLRRIGDVAIQPISAEDLVKAAVDWL